MGDAKPTEVTEDPHAACLQQAAELEAKWKRARADYENREKDLAREREDFAKFCSVGLIRDLLPIGDAIRAAGDGLDGLRKLFDEFMRRQGVEVVGTVGDRVNYLFHEIVGTRAEEGREAGAVLEVVQVGYTMHGRLLRPAKVIVAK